jgi:lipopolysaccharide biosynthesis regulator YciM
MRLRTFLIIALVLAAIYLIVGGLAGNTPLLRQEFHLTREFSIPVGWALMWSFVLGVGLTAFIGLTRELGLLVDRWRLGRKTRKAEEIEEEYSRGLVAVLEGREDDALRHFRAVLERDSRHFNTLVNLGDVLRQRGRHAEAVEVHRKAHHLKPDSTRPLYALVEDHEAQGDMDRARAVMGRVLALQKNSVDAWRKLRALHEKEQRWDKALEAQSQVDKLSPGGPTEADRRTGLGLRYEAASASLAAGKPRDAIAAFRRLVRDHPSFIPAHVGLGQALARTGNEADGIAAWHEGFTRTGSPVFLALLEEHFLQREEPLGAIEALKRCIARARKDTLARFYLGKLFFRLEMLDEAFATLSSLEGRADYAPTLHYLLGRIHERRQGFRHAAHEYRRVIKEMELVELDHKCRACGHKMLEWTDRCPACREWNTVEVNFREEIPLEDLGLSQAPIYTADD